MTRHASHRLVETTVNLTRIEPDTLTIRRPRRYVAPTPLDLFSDGPTEEIRLPRQHLRLRRGLRTAAHLTVAFTILLAVCGVGAWLGWTFALGTSPVVVCPIDRR